MEPHSSMQPSAQLPQPDATPPRKDKKMLLIVIVMGVVLAFAIAFIVVLLTKESDDTAGKKDTNSQNSNTNDTTDNGGSSVSESKDIVTVETQEPGVTLTITGINKSGNALTINYKLNHDNSSDEPSKYVSAYSAGVFTSNYSKSMAEPYFVSNADGQKYGLVKDSASLPLASRDVTARLKKGASVNGYFTISLPPNNASGALSVGNINIPNLTIRY